VNGVVEYLPRSLVGTHPLVRVPVGIHARAVPLPERTNTTVTGPGKRGDGLIDAA